MNHTLETITLEIKDGRANWGSVPIGGLHRARELIVRSVSFDSDQKDRAFVLRCRTLNNPLAIVRHGCIVCPGTTVTVDPTYGNQSMWHFELDEQRTGRSQGSVEKITCKITMLLEAVWPLRT